MRVAYYVPDATDAQPGVGGSPVMVHNLMQGLAQRGHEVRFASHLHAPGFRQGSVSPSQLVAETRAVRDRMRAFAPDGWLVYQPASSEPDLFGWWLRPRSYVLYGAHSPGAIPWSDGWRAVLLAIAHRRSLARADKVIAWRPTSASRLRAYGVPPERLALLPTAAECWDPLPSRSEARQRLALPAEAPIILCAGRFTSNRRGRKPRKTEMMLDLIDHVAMLPSEVILLLVGDNGPGRARLEERASMIQPPGRVRVIVSLDHAQMRWFYAACDVYAYPNPKDTPWISVMEAQYCARPVVVTRTASAELTVQHGRTGLLATTPEEFRGHLATLIAEPDRCQAMGHAGREYIAANHSLELRVRQLEAMLADPYGGCP